MIRYDSGLKVGRNPKNLKIRNNMLKIKRFSRLMMRTLEPNKDTYSLNRNIRFEKNMEAVEKDPSAENVGKLVARTAYDQTIGKAISEKLKNI